jgi:hypothetical protein
VLNDALHQVQICGDALRTVVDLLDRDLRVGFTGFFAVERTHAFHQFVLDDGDHGIDAEVGHLHGRVDGITEPHHGM